ncbi:MAG: hypothetical protein EOS54_25980 [Mesorhizobium sp.]|uniref:hypothetical protein n=1 Tax=unclassified Mesorhizobium TaxID=325217 RepID=UPI000F752522|nr:MULTISPECIES: hypothetical protein [unclassified Mesorhizobium]AZO47580.1 hypothetical protein EJ073_06795 [Mesorhizobium sp. M4B.F.Ca.ET.058.02.1.1]RVC42636.1 hypothetical protein EN781_21510 [Mesorhizobium sp. M4A.F.Ca.ET.090.04.2.1]RWC42575.1 MAG: hypothetical protein EOS54_25980 [Mesorhizobium sp.]RWD13239.1 MAG: hypothetical protein EOS74_20860 [Mesorhizobium sp.]RWD51981.1 MAG: hypothetical protein EOS75_30425 [Mesorhizobium sp.]
MPGEAVYLLFGVWALAILVVFVQATRLSYRIEARSPDLANRSGVPRKAMLFHTVTNLSVARDEETQGLRRKMIRLLLIVVGGFLVLAVGIGLVDRTP